MLTLRQIEVIRAVMVTGTVNGAAQMLNVSAPGVSRIMKTSDNGFEVFAPLYQQWNSFRSINVNYNPNQVLYISTSNIFINICNENELELEYDGDRVPNDTKVKFYFVRGNQLAKAKYK